LFDEGRKTMPEKKDQSTELTAAPSSETMDTATTVKRPYHVPTWTYHGQIVDIKVAALTIYGPPLGEEPWLDPWRHDQ
jgi:hypothetical protein